MDTTPTAGPPQRRRRGTALTAVALLWLLAAVPPCHAAQSEESAETARATAAEDAGPDTEAEAGRRAEPPDKTAPPARPAANGAPEAPGNSPEVFVPSEDISEDLSVRFPVDI